MFKRNEKTITVNGEKAVAREATYAGMLKIKAAQAKGGDAIVGPLLYECIYTTNGERAFASPEATAELGITALEQLVDAASEVCGMTTAGKSNQAATPKPKRTRTSRRKTG